MSEDPTVQPISSPKRDFKQLGKNSQAVVGELREFLATLQGKSPQEMMGAVAQSSLARSLVVSTLVMAVLVFSLSVIPYYLKQGSEGEETVVEDGKRAAGNSEEQPYDPEADQGREKEVPVGPAAPMSSEQKAADILGVGEVADPESNPLESSTDDLLDGLDDL
jgi:hypothetical protein